MAAAPPGAVWCPCGQTFPTCPLGALSPQQPERLSEFLSPQSSGSPCHKHGIVPTLWMKKVRHREGVGCSRSHTQQSMAVWTQLWCRSACRLLHSLPSRPAGISVREGWPPAQHPGGRALSRGLEKEAPTTLASLCQSSLRILVGNRNA